ncbi:hypothetical protein NDU88_007402 [Pleurodeles waltl]|uniref:Secreted protein n=1 Tax=Pleurodeles waltl TaxID=8319 RepID=A0AAV7VTH1_PLEWA|nr:hypothetical protein NDU88_007402 [Pleurodeles waltl]
MSVWLAAALGTLQGSSGVRPSRISSAPPVALRGTAILLTPLLQFLDSHQARWRMFAPPVPLCHQPLSNSVVQVAGWPGVRPVRGGTLHLQGLRLPVLSWLVGPHLRTVSWGSPRRA